jgi:hypothetical protein
MNELLSPFRTLSGGIDALVCAHWSHGHQGKTSPLRSATLVVLSSLEATFLYLSALVLGLMISMGGELQGAFQVLGTTGLMVVLIVPVAWTHRLVRWLEIGDARTLRIRRKIPARGDWWVWVEESDGTPWKGAHRCGPWAEALLLGSEVRALVDPRGRKVLWIPPPCDQGGQE